ncbi:MAG: hypothetical protein ACTHXT_14715 [Sphingobacterium sp.]
MENSDINIDRFDNCLAFILNLTKTKVAEIFSESHFPSKFDECQHTSKSYEHGCMKFYFSLTSHNREKVLRKAQDLPISTKIEQDIKIFVKAQDFNCLVKYLLGIPDDCQFEYQIGFSTYTFIKLSNSKFEISSTTDSWKTAQEQTELVCLFLLGKLASTYFAWY